MKKMSFPLIMLLTVALASLAQDQAPVPVVHENQLADDVQEPQKEVSVGKSADISKKEVYPLDHGPHAVVTPWVNQQRKLQASENEKMKSAEVPKQTQEASTSGAATP